MMLSRLQCRRFHNLFDPLMRYANGRLGIVDEERLYAREPLGIDVEAQSEVAQAVWQNTEVIADFVRENPVGLVDSELEIIASWIEAPTELFIADVFPDGTIKLMTRGFAFEVCSATSDIETILDELPAAVQTTLLPFDGQIVFAEYLVTGLVDIEDELIPVFEQEIERLYDEGMIMRSADDLMQAATALRASAASYIDPDETSQGAYNADDGCECGHEHHHVHAHDSNAVGGFAAQLYETEPGTLESDADYGQHRGALAGLSFEEREQAIYDHMMRDDVELAERLVDLLETECSEGPIAHGLLDLLAKEDPVDARRFATYLGLEGVRAMKDDELFATIVEHIADEGAVRGIVAELSEPYMEALRDLADHGGTKTVSASNISTMQGLPTHEVGLSYVFRDGDEFVFVMPDEVIEIVRAFDWDELLGHARAYRELIGLVDNLAELRGIVPIWDAINEYRRCYPDGIQSEEMILRLLIQAIADEYASFQLLRTESFEMYVLHYMLFWAYQEETDREDAPSFVEPVASGELSEMLTDLLARQQGIEPRPLSPEMLEARSLYDWKMRFEPAWAFCQYLDEHVPDICDDYYFSEQTIEGLIGEAQWGLPDEGAQRLFAILEANNFVPQVEQVQEVLDLWSNLCDGLPTWPNNGWSADELTQMQHGTAADSEGASSPAVNSDGKVDHDDLCPCGSGLEYKKCCGK